MTASSPRRSPDDRAARRWLVAYGLAALAAVASARLRAFDDGDDHPAAAIVRQPLLTAALRGGKMVERVEAKRIDFAGRQRTGLHRHPCPVVGYLARGTIVFQIDGQPERTLQAGEAFYEPAFARIVRFDNATDQPATFVAYYLLGQDDHALIEMLP